MRYVFFDVEGANPRLRTMCSFGYVVTDEDFNVTERDDIAINPHSEYDWYVAKNIIKYSTDELREMPSFGAVYRRISGLLTGADTLIFGYSIINDLDYINAECKRYRKKSLDFRYYDIQKLVCLYRNEKNQIGLENAASMFDIVDEADKHRSDRDAYMSMLVLRGLISRGAFDISSLPAEATGENRSGLISWREQRHNKKHRSSRRRTEKKPQ